MEKQTLIIDVRTKEEFADGHAHGSVNMPIDRLESEIKTVPKDTRIIVVCESGGRAMAAQALLKRLGFAEVTCGGSWRVM